MGIVVMSQNPASRIGLLSLLYRSRINTVERGFTLIELLTVIIIGGILSAIALPTILNQVNKAKESEARLYVGSVNKAQQAYFMEKARFSDSINKLGVGVSDTENYVYVTTLGTDPSDNSNVAYTTATQVNTDLRAFAGQTWNGIGGNNLLSFAVVCASQPGGAPPTITNHQCP